MRCILQRVSQAKVSVSGDLVGSIEEGLLILVGFTPTDEMADLDWMTRKIVQLRIFDDVEGKMNLSLDDVGGDLLVVSQFTLYANTKKGNRPSYIRAARPAQAEELFDRFVDGLKVNGRRVETGHFGAMMKVSLVNDGPVTIQIDSKQRE